MAENEEMQNRNVEKLQSEKIVDQANDGLNVVKDVIVSGSKDPTPTIKAHGKNNALDSFKGYQCEN